jgi:hypothetical protein
MQYTFSSNVGHGITVMKKFTLGPNDDERVLWGRFMVFASAEIDDKMAYN